MPSSMNNTIFVYNWDGRFIKEFSTSAWNAASSPSDVRINSKGKVLGNGKGDGCLGEMIFTDTGSGRVLIVK